jgi:hypothetical protein
MGKVMSAELKDFLTASMPAIMERTGTSGTREQLRAMVEKLNAGRSGTVLGAAGPDGDDTRVVAEVDGSGTLVALEISPHGHRDLDAVALGVACTEALDAARLTLAAQLRSVIDELTAEFVGDLSLPELRFTGVDDMLAQAREVGESWSQWTRPT